MERPDNFTALIGSVYGAAVDHAEFADLLTLADRGLFDDGLSDDMQADNGLADETARRRQKELRRDLELHVTKAETLIAIQPRITAHDRDFTNLNPRFNLDRQHRISAANSAAIQLLGLADGQDLETL